MEVELPASYDYEFKRATWDCAAPQMFERLVTRIIEKLHAETSTEEALHAKMLMQRAGGDDAAGPAADVADPSDGAKTDASTSKCTLL